MPHLIQMAAGQNVYAIEEQEQERRAYVKWKLSKRVPNI